MGIVTDVVLPLALAFIMFSLGLGLTVSDFARVARQPKDFFVGAVSQVVLLPLVGFILVTVWPVAPEIALGVMIIAAAPGGVTSNLLTAFGRGDVALSISLTAVISLLSVLTIPLIVVFSYGQFFGEAPVGEVSVARIAVSVFLIVTVPVLIGLVVRHYAPLRERVCGTLRAGIAEDFDTPVYTRSTGRNISGAQQCRRLLCRRRPDHPGAECRDAGARLVARFAIRLWLDPAHRHFNRMRAPERNPGDRRCDAFVWRRCHGCSGRDLQPDDVRNGAHLHLLSAAERRARPCRGLTRGQAPRNSEEFRGQ